MIDHYEAALGRLAEVSAHRQRTGHDPRPEDYGTAAYVHALLYVGDRLDALVSVFEAPNPKVRRSRQVEPPSVQS